MIESITRCKDESFNSFVENIMFGLGTRQPVEDQAVVVGSDGKSNEILMVQRTLNCLIFHVPIREKLRRRLLHFVKVFQLLGAPLNVVFKDVEKDNEL